jgi:hypothetical protein
MSKFRLWQPKTEFEIPKEIFVESLTDNYSGLTITIQGENESSKLITIQFNDHYGYRNFDESERLKMFADNPILTSNWGLYVAEESDLISWLVKESHEVVNPQDVLHYLIVTPNDVIDVLSRKEHIEIIG